MKLKNQTRFFALSVGSLAAVATVAEALLQILYYFAKIHVISSVLKYWGILWVSLMFLYLLVSLITEHRRKELIPWALGLATSALSFLTTQLNNGLPQFLLFVSGGILSLGTLICAVFFLSQRKNGALSILLLMALIFYSWGYVLFCFRWDAPMDGFLPGDLILIPLSIAYLAMELRAQCHHTEAKT